MPPRASRAARAGVPELPMLLEAYTTFYI